MKSRLLKKFKFFWEVLCWRELRILNTPVRQGNRAVNVLERVWGTDPCISKHLDAFHASTMESDKESDPDKICVRIFVKIAYGHSSKMLSQEQI